MTHDPRIDMTYWTNCMTELRAVCRSNLAQVDLAAGAAPLCGAFPGAGTHQLVWNGRDGSGAFVASGTYFARLRGRGFDLRHRLVLLR